MGGLGRRICDKKGNKALAFSHRRWTTEQSTANQKQVAAMDDGMERRHERRGARGDNNTSFGRR